MAVTDPIYFYSTEKDICNRRNHSFTAPNNSAYGDLCAYIATAPTDCLWACPAGNATCWTEGRTCTGGRGPQVQCFGVGAANGWCCDRNYEQCPNNGQSFVCLAARFDNPLAKVEPSLASQIAKSALEASETGDISTALTALSVTPTTTSVPGVVYATSTLDSDSLDSTRSAGVSSDALVSTGAATTSGVATSGSADLNSDPGMSAGSRLSKGAIAGIVVTIVAVLALAGFVLFWIIRRRRRRAQRRPATTAAAGPPSNLFSNNSLKPMVEINTVPAPASMSPADEHMTPFTDETTPFTAPTVSPSRGDGPVIATAHHQPVFATPQPQQAPKMRDVPPAYAPEKQHHPVSPILPPQDLLNTGPSHLRLLHDDNEDEPPSPISETDSMMQHDFSHLASFMPTSSTTQPQAQPPRSPPEMPIVSTTEPSPLQTLMLHGRYPRDDT